MNRKKVINLVTVLVTALIAATVTLSFLWTGGGTPPVALNTTELQDVDGTPIAAVSILDLKDSNIVTKANYAPDEFLRTSPGSSQGQVPFGTPIDLADTDLASKGTLRFAFLNLDPWSSDFASQSEELAPYLGADNYWHFSFYLPPIFSASTVYVRSKLVAAAGLISDYNFINYSEYYFDSINHKDGTEPVILDLNFPAKRETILANRLQAALTVTIHYEGVNGRFTGLTGMPLIGKSETVENLIGLDQTFLISLLITSVLILAVFIFLCFLKKTFSFLPQPSMTLGVCGVLLAAYIFTRSTSVPYFSLALSFSALAAMLLAAVFALRVSWKKRPVWLVPAFFGALNCVLAFIAPFIAGGQGLLAYLPVGNAVTAVFILLLSFFQSRTADQTTRLINPVLVGVTGLTAAFYPSTSLAFASPVLWLFVLIVAVTVVVCFEQFVNMEKRNRYLTANLAEEVRRQTHDLEAVIAEREKILMYVSHDMKKPVVFMDGALSDLRHYLTDEQLAAKAAAIQLKNSELKRDFAELSKFSRLNYSAEPSEIFNASEVVRTVSSDLKPDCEANGILLTVIVPSRIDVYAKKNGFSGVLVNLILNAVEHSRCRHLTVSVGRKKGFCQIEVTDDGTGLKADRDIFEPYFSSTGTEENSGLGLYLARNSIRSMGGELAFKQTERRLTFVVTVPLA